VLLGVRTQVDGVMPTGAVLVAAKHQSMFETIDFLLLLDRPAVVLKRELADLPGWGAIARQYGVIPVDREGGAAALRRMLKAAQAAVAAGRPILIFPEGTRVPMGEQPPLQPGFAGLYKSLAIPVVPVALDSGRVWPRRSFVKRPGIVTMRVGETIPPGLPRREVEERVHATINALEKQ
jgi:1-acyl-sn-glycerol-3-phosphate acyltransferase